MISLIHPSRGRYDRAYHTLREWISKSSSEIEHILSLDESDPQVARYQNTFIRNRCANTQIIVNPNSCVVEATNHAAKIATGDIMLYLSDDFKCPHNWDKELISRFKDVESPMLLKVDDCLQQFHVDVLTIPIMNRGLYERLGYFWHPEYKSMFVDQDLYWTCHKHNWIVPCPELKFEHQHYSVGKSKKDETYTRSDSNWNQGKELYRRRKSLNFPL